MKLRKSPVVKTPISSVMLKILVIESSSIILSWINVIVIFINNFTGIRFSVAQTTHDFPLIAIDVNPVVLAALNAYS